MSYTLKNNTAHSEGREITQSEQDMTRNFKKDFFPFNFVNKQE